MELVDKEVLISVVGMRDVLRVNYIYNVRKLWIYVIFLYVCEMSFYIFSLINFGFRENWIIF